MRTRIFTVPTSGTPTSFWQSGNTTTGQTGALLPFTTAGGLSANTGGTLQGPGTFISAQFSMSTAPASLYVALDTNGATSGLLINLESYADFAWTTLDSASLGSPSSAAANLPAANQLGLLRVRISISGNASATCAAILNTTATAQGGGGTGGNGVGTGDWEFRADLVAATGGSGADLDGVDTTSISFGHVIAFNFAGQLAAYQYRDSNGGGGGGNPSPNGITRINALNSTGGVWVRIL